MARYLITHKCTHQSEHEIFGTTRERNGKASWLAKGDCSACHFTRKASEAAAASVSRGLPALTGSDKQVKWGTQLRETFAVQLETAQEQWAADLRKALAATPEALTWALDIVIGVVSSLEARLQEWTSAKEWIEARTQASPYNQITLGFAAHKSALKTSHQEERAAQEAAKVRETLEQTQAAFEAQAIAEAAPEEQAAFALASDPSTPSETLEAVFAATHKRLSRGISGPIRRACLSNPALSREAWVQLFCEEPRAALQNPALPLWFLEDHQLWSGIASSVEQYERWLCLVSHQDIEPLLFEGAREYVLRANREPDFLASFFEVERYWVGLGGAVRYVRNGGTGYAVSLENSRIPESRYEEVPSTIRCLKAAYKIGVSK